MKIPELHPSDYLWIALIVLVISIETLSLFGSPENESLPHRTEFREIFPEIPGNFPEPTGTGNRNR